MSNELKSTVATFNGLAASLGDKVFFCVDLGEATCRTMPGVISRVSADHVITITCDDADQSTGGPIYVADFGARGLPYAGASATQATMAAGTWLPAS